MGIGEKLDEIRKKPEHIRMRYVFALVAVSMILVVAIWIFSLSGERNEGVPMPESFYGDTLSDVNKQADSVKNSVNNLKSAVNQNQAPDNNLNNNSPNINQ